MAPSSKAHTRVPGPLSQTRARPPQPPFTLGHLPSGAPVEPLPTRLSSKTEETGGLPYGTDTLFPTASRLGARTTSAAPADRGARRGSSASPLKAGPRAGRGTRPGWRRHRCIGRSGLRGRVGFGGPGRPHGRYLSKPASAPAWSG